MNPRHPRHPSILQDIAGPRRDRQPFRLESGLEPVCLGGINEPTSFPYLMLSAPSDHGPHEPPARPSACPAIVHHVSVWSARLIGWSARPVGRHHGSPGRSLTGSLAVSTAGTTRPNGVSMFDRLLFIPIVGGNSTPSPSPPPPLILLFSILKSLRNRSPSTLLQTPRAHSIASKCDFVVPHDPPEE